MTEEISTISNRKISLIYELAQLLAGDFSNQKQAFADPKNYAHIRIFFRPLPRDFFNGIGFYSEQVYDWDLWSPYRQGVHRLVARENDVYIENYALEEAELYAGAGRDLDILKSISPENIKRRYNCSMIFSKNGNTWHGKVEGDRCFIERKGCKTYLVSDVELTETTWVSFDRGMDLNSHEQVWGSAAGPLKFENIASFAAELTH
ncbi:MAG: chromophore lyase CpcT/CpeT [Prochloraceae cyanobacterium]